jgi:hypothetical protein
MARSKLAGLYGGSLRPSRDDEIVSKDVTFLSFELNIRHADVHKYNMGNFCNEGCASTGKRIKNRIKPIHQLANNISRMLRDGAAHRTIDTYLVELRRYIQYCDHTGVDPFTRNGFQSYCGNDGELWRLVRIAREPKPFLFMYEDGEKLGITESSAQARRASVANVLELCGIFSVKWRSGFRVFKSVHVPNKPYSEKEMRVILRRLQLFFFSLATQIIEYAEKNPGKLPPDELIAEVDINNDGVSITKNISSFDSGAGDGEERVQVGSPFNRCMQAGYFLFSYYTSFNDSTITDVRHPIDIQVTEREGRIIRHAKVRGWKGRSNKFVDAMFSDASVDIESLPEAEGDSAGYVSSGLIDKKNGAQFIKVLTKVSQLYQTEPHGKLFCLLGKDGTVQKYRYRYDSDLSSILNILAEDRIRVVDHLIEAFYLAKDKAQKFSIDKVTHPGGRYVRRRILPMDARGVGLMLVQYTAAAVSCFTDYNLKNILIPLSFSPKNDDGNVTVSFNYLDGNAGSFDIPAKYQKFFEDVQCFAETRNPYKAKTNRPQNNPRRPAFLIPMGMRCQTYQWDGLTPVKSSRVRDIGIALNQYFIGLTSARFRASTANAEYRSEDGGLTVTQILQHQLQTMMTRYSNGHPDENAVITSQAMQVLEQIAKGDCLDDAKEKVRQKLNIPVLAHDEYVALRKPANINGIYCEGKPDIEGVVDEHVAAKNFARKMGLNDEGLDIGCYQYDLCVFCKSSKLVDDVEQVYKLLSFVECLEEAIDMYPDSVERLSMKVDKFNTVLEGNVSEETIRQAEERLLNDGRYPLLQDVSTAVMQFV